MNTNNSTSSNNRSFVDRYFHFQENKTTLRTELVASFTTFITMVYIVFVNPKILGDAGMNSQAVFVTTALITGIACLLMGIVAKLPIALAPGMGINAYFAYVLVGSMGLNWQTGMTLVFLGASGLFLLSLFKLRYWMIANIPFSIRIGVSSGCGLLITLIGLHNAEIIVADPDTMVKLGNPTSYPFMLGCVSFLIVAGLAQRGWNASILCSFIVVTLIGWAFDPNVVYHGIVSLPPDISSVVGQLDFSHVFEISLVGIIISVMLINLFESSGTFIAVTDKAGLADKHGRYPNQQRSLYIDSASSALGSAMGTSAVTAYVESASGVAVGGRTGMMACGVGVLFLLMIFFSPLEKMVPLYATTGALIYIGVLMASDLARIKWEDLTESVPAFVTTIMMPFSFTITEGIATGFITYVFMKVFSGKFKDLTACTIIMAILFLARYIFL
ncbi:AGZA family xanthine/uracil permease-like MFS transporter [Orbus hercynius]|uniref:AGZA family xanthine/uracil permease-like MFS transporter n=1 Tax=Orbus hercynius TaxID=593135 RepID=A0A495RJ14_9GAMM|nr:NCS2 family permease [Orbus hercynius]RKS87280.1 AGZA family xanthine/uracil permease-like MFS transporter [Orbus hercynius]